MSYNDSPVRPSSVLVIGNYPQTLAVVRSLGRAGFHVILGRTDETPIAQRSRFCHELWTHPPLQEPEGFHVALHAFLKRRLDIRHVFPVAEGSIRTLMSMSSLAEYHVDLVMVAAELVRRCADKQAANELAVGAGLMIPETGCADNYAALKAHCGAIGYPVILKPLASAQRLMGRKALIVTSAEELHELVPSWPTEHRTLMVQRYVEGTLEAADFVAQSGVVVGYCEAHSVRTDMLDGTGLGVEFESIPPSPDVLDATRAFVGALGYSGPGLIQFMRSARDGRLYFLENNPRLSAGVADSIACGQDVPLLSVQALSHHPEHPLPAFNAEGEPYRTHHHAYWLQRDIEGWLAQRSRLSLGETLGWLGNMLRSFVRADSHINWQWDDPLPCLGSYAGMLKRFFRRFLRTRPVDQPTSPRRRPDERKN